MEMIHSSEREAFTNLQMIQDRFPANYMPLNCNDQQKTLAKPLRWNSSLFEKRLLAMTTVTSGVFWSVSLGFLIIRFDLESPVTAKSKGILQELHDDHAIWVPWHQSFASCFILPGFPWLSGVFRKFRDISAWFKSIRQDFSYPLHHHVLCHSHWAPDFCVSSINWINVFSTQDQVNVLHFESFDTLCISVSWQFPYLFRSVI